MRARQVSLTEETNRLSEENASLDKFCKDLTSEVSQLKKDIININGSCVGFHHTRCIIVNNLRFEKDDPRHAIQNLINNEMKMVGINVSRVKQLRGLFLAELGSPDHCRAVLNKKKYVTSLRSNRIYISAAKSPEVLNVERSLKAMLQLIPGTNELYKFTNNGRLIKKHKRDQHSSKREHTSQHQFSTQHHPRYQRQQQLNTQTIYTR